MVFFLHFFKNKKKSIFVKIKYVPQPHNNTYTIDYCFINQRFLKKEVFEKQL